MDALPGVLFECTLNEFANTMCLPELDEALPLFIARGIEAILLLVSFCGLAASADVVCNALETGCDRWGIEEDVAGATFLAIGGALPETTVNMVVTLQSVFTKSVHEASTVTHAPPSKHRNKTMLGVGAIIGSGVIAFLLIPIVCYFVSPKRMSLKRRPLARDVFFYFLMMTLLISTIENGVTPGLCALLVGTYALYLCVTLFGRKVRLRALNCFGVEYVPRRQSIYRDRYEEEQTSASLSEPLVPGTRPSKEAPSEAESEAPAKEPLLKRVCYKFAEICTKPVDVTCIDCRINGPYEKWYPLTIVVGLAWISFYSWMVTCLVSHVVYVLHAGDRGMGFLGFFLVAIGAEIPDTFQAATAARRGYGSMAISSCIGAQVVNVGVGLGLPWIIVTGAGLDVPLIWPHGLSYMAYAQRANACIVLCILIITSWFTLDRKAEMTGSIVSLFILLYVTAIGALGMWTFDHDEAQRFVDGLQQSVRG
jgi:Ca2+/Na+ antiporter